MPEGDGARLPRPCNTFWSLTRGRIWIVLALSGWVLIEQGPCIFVPEHQRGVVAFPHASVAAPPAARGGLGGRLPEVVACGLQAVLKLRNAPAHGRALGCVGVDDGVIVVFGHAPLSVSLGWVFVGR